MDSITLILVGAWGGITVFLAVIAMHYRLKLVQIIGVLRAWEQMGERPAVALFKDEQVDSLAQALLPRLQAGLRGQPFVN